MGNKKIFLTILGFIIILLVGLGYVAYTQGKGSGNIISESRSVADFNKVKLSGTGNLIIEQTGEESLTIEAEDNLVARIKTRVVGDTLEIYIHNPYLFWSFWPTKEINYYLTVYDLNSISVAGSGHIFTQRIDTKQLDINISGSGQADLLINTTDLAVNISGSGEFTLMGTAKKQNINISGSGKYSAKGLSSQEATINISGSGQGIINASDKLNVDVSGSGNIQYLGTPIIDQKVSGSGSISQLNE